VSQKVFADKIQPQRKCPRLQDIFHFSQKFAEVDQKGFVQQFCQTFNLTAGTFLRFFKSCFSAWESKNKQYIPSKKHRCIKTCLILKIIFAENVEKADILKQSTFSILFSYPSKRGFEKCCTSFH